MSNLAPSSVLALFHCPLCYGERIPLYHIATHAVPWHLYAPETQRGEGLRFFRCEECSLVVKDPNVRSTCSQERLHYEKHNNDLTNAGYREHLLELVRPLVRRLSENARGLDFGCGPGLSIEPLMRDFGVRCISYDPIFYPQEELLTPDTYEYISCCEVPEHFREPQIEFRRLHMMLRTGGILGLRTRTVPDDFQSWWYHRDPTHVVFYSERAFDWIANHFGFELLERRGDVTMLRKS